MNTPVDEGDAWRLLRAVAKSDGVGPRSVALDGTPGVALEIDPRGEWSATAPLTDTARSLLDICAPLVTRRDVVVGQLGQSVDGRIATESGASHYVTGSEDLDRLHRLRALCDAVVVGANTVASDDPQLTVRRVDGTHPVRVVLDPDARLSEAYKVFTDGAARTIVVHRAESRGGSASEGVEEMVVPDTQSGTLDLVALLGLLRAQGLRRVLVEGGGLTVSGFLQAGLLDRLHVAVAPMLIGSGRPSLTLDPIVNLDEALRPACRHFSLGRDVLFDFDLRSRHE